MDDWNWGSEIQMHKRTKNGDFIKLSNVSSDWNRYFEKSARLQCLIFYMIINIGKIPHRLRKQLAVPRNYLSIFPKNAWKFIVKIKESVESNDTLPIHDIKKTIAKYSTSDTVFFMLMPTFIIRLVHFNIFVSITDIYID